MIRSKPLFQVTVIFYFNYKIFFFFFLNFKIFLKIYKFKNKFIIFYNNKKKLIKILFIKIIKILLFSKSSNYYLLFLAFNLIMKKFF